MARPFANLVPDWVFLHVRNVEPTPAVLAFVDAVADVVKKAVHDGSWQGVQLEPRITERLNGNKYS